jgi:hypothetical protein
MAFPGPIGERPKMNSDSSNKERSYLPRSWGSQPNQRKSPLEEANGTPETNQETHEDDMNAPDERSETKPDEIPSDIDQAEVREAPLPRPPREESFRERMKRTSESRQPLSSPVEAQEPAPCTAEGSSTKFKIRISGVRFAYACKIYHFETADMELAMGDWVIVKTEKGVGLGQIAIVPFER